MDVKEPIVFCKQIEKLQEHGCEIENYNQAIMILNKINYYKLSAYFLPFKNSDGTYRKGTSLLRVYKIYEFDRKLIHYYMVLLRRSKYLLKHKLRIIILINMVLWGT